MPATIYHAYTNTVADGTATSVVRPSDWNSAHQITLSPSGQEIIGAFSNAGNVTFGTNTAGYVTATAPAGGAADGGNVIAVAGSTNATTGTVLFSNANGVTFGLNAGTVTASHNGLTTAAQSNHSHNFATTTTNGSQIVVGTTNSAGATIGVPPFITTQTSQQVSVLVSDQLGSSSWGADKVAFYAGVASDGGVVNFNKYGVSQIVGQHNALETVIAGSDSVYVDFNSINFANSNGISFGVGSAGSVVTASHNALTTAAQSNHSHGNPTLALTNLSGTTASNSNGLTLSLSAAVGGGGDGYNIIGVNGGGTALSTTLQLSNANNVSFGLNAGTITASASYPTTYRASNDAIGLNTALTANGLSVTANSSGLSINVPAWLTTAANSTHSHNFATTTTNGSQIVVGTTNSAGATIGVPPFITTYVAQTTQTQPAGNIAGVGTTFGGTNVSGSMTLNSNGLALSLSAPTPGGGGAINVSAGTTSGNLQTIQFDNANGVTFGLNGSTVTASVNAGGALAAYRAYPVMPVALSSSSLVSGTSGAGSTSAAFYVNPLYLDRDINAQEIELLMSHGALSAGTGSATCGWHLGFYTLATTGGVTQLASVSTFSAAAYISQNSATAQSIHTYWGSTSNANSTATQGNISAAFMTAGLRDIKLYDSSFTLTSGTYYLAHCFTMRSSSVNIATSFATGMYAQGITNRAYLGQSTIGAPLADRYIGSFTSQVTGAAGNTLSMSMPALINTTAITVSATNAGRFIIPRMYN